MGFSRSMDIAAAGMSAQRGRLEIIASNLANAQTTRTARGEAYRKKLVIFEAVGLQDDQGLAFVDQLQRELKSVKIDRIVEDRSPLQRVYQPNHPDADPQGYVLMPNVNIVDEMVNMIGATRSYEANLEVLQTVKRMAGAALELGRS
jgi:flagellar basal-body rod protein FlgC